MQCSQPFYGPGYPSNVGPSYPFNYSFPNVPQPSLYPEIIGEGEVASVVYPDGSVHLYFIPINKRFPSNNYHHQNNYAPYYNAMGAYYVRAISNPMSAAIFNQQCQKMYTGPYSRPCYISDCNLNIPSPGFQLKFHNDCWTSTTDLHYFFPCIRECDWFPSTQLKRCASVQVDIPEKESTVYHEVICAKPCLCSKIESTVYHEPLCPKPCSCSQNEDKKLSEDESADECQNSIIGERKQNKNKKSRARKQKLEKKKSDVICECNEANTTDKSIATVTDQGSSCVANERDTQTSKPPSGAATSFPGLSSVNRSDVKTELWIPKSSFSKAVRIKSSENIIGIYETGSSSATCCCSDGD